MTKSIFHRFVARYRKNRFVSYLLDRSGRNLSPSQWVFIVGCYNSGTTLLEQILSLHSGISSLHDEGVILTDQLKRPEDFGYNRIWYPVKDALYIDPHHGNAPERAGIIKRHWSHFFDRRKSIYIEKSISNAVRIDFLNTYFSPASFIYIVRNGYAVSEGIKRKANPKKLKDPVLTEYSWEMCSRQWSESDVTIRKALAGKRHMCITYEELTENTIKTVDSLCDFLTISHISPEQLEDSFAVHGTVSAIRNMNKSSIQKLTPDAIAKIEEGSSEILKFYNYRI